MDVFDKEKRRWIMSRVKSTDTNPEIIVRSFVHKLGFRFRKNKSDLQGSPDIVLPKYRIVIFVNGCFWHGHNKCKRSSRPTSNKRFWQKKLNYNIERDKKNIRILRTHGWRVLVLWECEICNKEKLLKKLSNYLFKYKGITDDKKNV